jgi:predicted Zn-ribbon and HTH transcriptional regulator
MKTRRERIVQLLSKQTMTASELAAAVEENTENVLVDIRHVASSLQATDAELLVAPPECEACGFDGFDDPVNRPSRCPECSAEANTSPTFTVRE